MPSTIRSHERGTTKLEWLDSHHTFSFGEYHNPEARGFGSIKGINEDVLMPGKGFEVLRHRNVEILSYVLEGRLSHSDSEGFCPTLQAGELQLISTGHGMSHSEVNAHRDQKTRCLQIWIEPWETNTSPEYQMTSVKEHDADGEMTLLASPDGRGHSLEIHQDLLLHRLKMENVRASSYPVEEGRKVWVHAVKGCGHVNGESLCEGDGMGFDHIEDLHFESKNPWEILVIDLKHDE